MKKFESQKPDLRKNKHDRSNTKTINDGSNYKLLNHIYEFDIYS